MPSHPANSRSIHLSPQFIRDYGTAVVNLIGEAMDKAWADFEPLPKNEGLARSLMWSAIVEGIEGNVREPDVLIRKATVALMAAIKLDPEALRGRGRAIL
jgi:hypothetical protein